MPSFVLGRAFGVAAVTAALAATAHAEVRSLTDYVLAQDRSEASPISLVAPPPAPDDLVDRGRHWRIETGSGPVRVWIPAGYDAATAATVVFVHGYWVTVDEAWTEYRLPQQFALSGVNAMFVAPAAPSAKREAIAWPSLNTLLETVRRNVDVPMPSRRLVAMGHSGAYRTLALWLPNPSLDTIVLLDALYGEYRFMPWVRQGKDRRLVNIAYETWRYSEWMHRSLPDTVRVNGLPESGLPDARVVYARTDVGHWALVTDGVAIPLALRAIGVETVADAPLDLPIGLPLRCEPAPPDTPRVADLER